MPIVLLLLGVVTTAAGLVLVGSGLSPRDGTFQTEVLTPGTIAAVGGLLLIAFGLAVREMRRIERSFAVRSASRTPRVDDAAAVAAFSAATSAPSLPETKLEPPPLPAAAPAPEFRPTKLSSNACALKFRRSPALKMADLRNWRIFPTRSAKRPVWMKTLRK